MKLYWLPISPFARKPLIAARERRVFEQLEVIETKVSPPNPELMHHNPLNKVPTLLLEDGTALYDSVVICEYLDSIGSGPKLFPAEGAARWDALRRHALGNGFAELLIAWRGEITQPPEMQSTERIDKHFLKTKRILELLERESQSERASFDIGDIAVGCALAYLQFRFPQFTPPESSALHAWYAAFAARPSVAATAVQAPTS